jgi:hypothetical protein
MQPTSAKVASQYPSEDEKFWEAHAQALKSSGLSRKAYCRQHNVNYDRFGYWLPKISVQPSSLVAVKLKPVSIPSTKDVLCTLSTNKGWHLSIHDVWALSLVLEKLEVQGANI